MEFYTYICSISCATRLYVSAFITKSVYIPNFGQKQRFFATYFTDNFTVGKHGLQVTWQEDGDLHAVWLQREFPLRSARSWPIASQCQCCKRAFWLPTGYKILSKFVPKIKTSHQNGKRGFNTFCFWPWTAIKRLSRLEIHHYFGGFSPPSTKGHCRFWQIKLLKRKCSLDNELWNKTKASSPGQFFREIQIFEVRVKVLWFLQNFENLWRFFMGEPWPWRPWTWCPQGGFRG